MADSTVAALPAATALTGAELFYGVQSSADVKITGTQIQTFTGGGGTTYKVTITGNVSAAAWTITGTGFVAEAASFTDTTSTGTVAAMYVHRFGIPTILASAATTYTAAYGLWVEPPTASTNVTFTNKYALGLNGRLSVPAGSTSNISLTFGRATYGFFGDSSDGSQSITFAGNGSETSRYKQAVFELVGNAYVVWSDQTNTFTGSTPDAGFKRSAASIVLVTQGENTTPGDILTRGLRSTAVAFASAIAAPVEGTLQAFTDSTTAVWRATITGGGANHVLGYYNGTNWTVAA